MDLALSGKRAGLDKSEVTNVPVTKFGYYVKYSKKSEISSSLFSRGTD